MAKHVWTEQKIAERLKKGYGEGTGATYKPWLEITDFSSQGRSRRVWSNKTGRTHHFFSDVEFDIFLYCDWSRWVVDIREQFPLDRELTQTIAQKLKIRHPHYPGTNVPTVMTVDFLLLVNGINGEEYIALNAKRDEEAEDVNSLQKLEIQRSYFEALNFPHYLIYHSHLPKAKIANIQWIRDAELKPKELEPYPNFYNDFQRRMGAELLGGQSSQQELLAGYCASFDSCHGLEHGTGIRIARMLMQNRDLIPDLSSPDLSQEPLSNFIMTSKQLRVVGGRDAV